MVTLLKTNNTNIWSSPKVEIQSGIAIPKLIIVFGFCSNIVFFFFKEEFETISSQVSQYLLNIWVVAYVMCVTVPGRDLSVGPVRIKIQFVVLDESFILMI
jgi:hypothetical protein